MVKAFQEDILFTLQVLQSDTLESFYQKNLFVDMNIVEYGLRSGDPYTIYIRLGEPSYHILDYLTFPVLPRSVYQSAEFIMESKSDFSLLPVGTGPYRVDPTHPYEGETIKLVKNESWWDGTPYIDSILGKIYATNDEAWDAFYQNDVDLVDTTVVYANTRLNRNNANHYKYLTSDFELLALNNTHALFQEKVIKKAMAYGIDRKDIISKVSGSETVDVLIHPIPAV